MPGLLNLGNTCFLNAAIQALAQLQPLNSLLEVHDVLISNLLPDEVLFHFDKLRRCILSEIDQKILPKSFVKICKQKANFDIGSEQQDLCEFIQFFLQTCEKSFAQQSAQYPTHPAEFIKSLCEKKEWSLFSALFNGITKSEIWQTLPCGKPTQVSSSPTFELFSILSVALGKKKSTLLLEALKKYTDPECLENENAWFNEKTNRYETAFRCLFFVHMPPVLILAINRFSELQKVQNTFIRMKKTNLLIFPLKFYVTQQKNRAYEFKTILEPSEQRFLVAEYNLRAICNHEGDSIDSGHYTSFVRNMKSNEWIFHDDGIALSTGINTDRSTDADLKKLMDIIVTPAAYCLFYEQTTYICRT